VGFDQSMIVGGDIDLFLLMLEQGDLAILDIIDCAITVHAGQESCFLEITVELFRIYFR